MDRMLHPEAGFDAFDGNRDGKLDAKDWDVFRAMLAAENGLMAIKLGGSGDMTEHRGEVEVPAARCRRCRRRCSTRACSTWSTTAAS